MSEKIQLKDVIHFYLGCDVLVLDIDGQTFEDKIEAVKFINGRWYFGIYEFGDCPLDNHEEYFQEIKPMLRPLSDMTENEKVELARHDNYYIFKDDWEAARTCDNITKSWEFRPETTWWLIANRFDIFGLIESNQAIDKSKPLPHVNR